MILTIHDAQLRKVAFVDNEKQGTLDFFDDTWTRNLQTGSSTYEFSISKKSLVSDMVFNRTYSYLNERAFVSFEYKGETFLFNVMTVEEDEKKIKCYCENLNLELINEYSNPFKADRAMSFVEYCNAMDLLNMTKLSVGINEISDYKRTLEWEGQDTKLARLISLANKFDAEIEFKTYLNDDSTINQFLVNVYHENDGVNYHGVGRDRKDITLVYGKNIKSIRRKIDKTNIFNMIVPTAQSEENSDQKLTIKSLPDWELKNDKGIVEFYKRGDAIYAPISAQLYPSTFTSETQSDQWTRRDMDFNVKSIQQLETEGLKQLKASAYPELTYEFDGYIDADIGDTVELSDSGFANTLLIEARIFEQKLSFSTKKNWKTTLGNFRALQSKLSNDIQSELERLVEDAKPYNIRLSTDNGTMFKNNEGESLVKATLWKGGKVVSRDVSWRWAFDGNVTIGMQYLVKAKNIKDTAVLTVSAYIGNNEVATTEITLTNVNDGIQGPQGEQGPKGDKGEDGRAETHRETFYKLTNEGALGNLVVESKLSKGWLNASGNGQILGPDTKGERTTDFIKVVAGKTYTFQWWSTIAEGQKCWEAWQFYDSNRNPFGARGGYGEYGSDGNQHGKRTITAPENACYIRLSFRSFGNGHMMFEVGAGHESFVPSFDDSLKLGGRNLMQRAGESFIMGYGITNTTWDDDKKWAYLALPDSKVSKSSEILPQGQFYNFEPIKGTTYTQSILIDTDASFDPNGNPIISWFTLQGHNHIKAHVEKLSDTTYRFWSTYTWQLEDITLRAFDTYNLYTVLKYRNSGTYLAFHSPKLEIGTQPTPWSLAPEDLGWSPTMLVPTQSNRYLWKFEYVYYSDGSVRVTNPVNLSIAGADGKTLYFHIAYADSADGRTGFSFNESGQKYQGYYTDFTQSSSTDPTKYTWMDRRAGVEFGARNLWIQSKATGEFVEETLPDNHITGQKKCYRIPNYKELAFNIEPDFSSRLYRKVTFSAWIKYDNVVQGENGWNKFNCFKHAMVRKNSSTGATTGTDYTTLEGFVGTSDWKYITYTYDYAANKSYDQLKTTIRFNLESAKSGTAWVTGVMVQFGNVATGHVWAPEDIQADIDSKADQVLTQEQLNALEAKRLQMEVELKAKATLEQVSELETFINNLKQEDSDGRQKIIEITKAIEERVKDIEPIMEYSQKLKFMDTYITQGNGGMVIGANDSTTKVVVTPDRISFQSGGSEVAYISQRMLHIDNGVFTMSLQLGHYITRAHPKNEYVNATYFVK